uniref:Ig-like domain-containing protein n=2 Tax=Cyprinus carpio carpio TaxID=630221 RepID=A0A8C1AHD9_CYPCA
MFLSFGRDTQTLILQREITMVMSLVISLPLILVIMTAGVDGQQYWAVNYGPSYVCALKRSTVKLSCALYHPHVHELTTAFWTKTAVTDGDPPNLCLDPENRGRVQCDSEDKDTYRITLTNVTKADKHIYYCRFTTDRGRWTGIPGAQLDVTDLQVETQQSVKEGDSVTLTCKSSCSLPQQTTFIWFRKRQKLTRGIITENQLQLQSVSRQDSGNYQCAVSEYQHLKSPPVYLQVGWVQRAALHTVTGIVVGCGGLIFIIIIIISVFIKKKRRDGGAVGAVARENQQEDLVGRSAETALTNDDPVYSLASANQTDDLYDKNQVKKPKRFGREQTEKDSGDAEEIQYASVHHFKNKDMNKTEETIEMQHPSDSSRSEDVIYSSVK